MVWVLDDIVHYLWQFDNWLYDLYRSSYDLWLIGDLAGEITYGMYYSMFYIAQDVEMFNDWCDDLYNDLYDVINVLDSVWDKIEEVVMSIAGFLSWSEIKAKSEATWSIITETADGIVSDAKKAVLGAYTSLDAWFDKQGDKVEDWVVARFETILDRVFK